MSQVQGLQTLGILLADVLQLFTWSCCAYPDGGSNCLCLQSALALSEMIESFPLDSYSSS